MKNRIMRMLFLGLLLSLFSCVHKESKIKTYKYFNKIVRLKGTHVGPKDFLMECRQMILVDTMILMSDNKTKKIFHLISSENFNLIKSFGVRGRGPHEFLFPELSKRLYENYLVITNNFITSLYDYTGFTNNQFLEPVKKIEYPPELTIPYNILYVNDSTIIGSTTSGQYRLFNYDPTHNKINYTVDDIIFNQRKSKAKRFLGQIYYSINDYNYSKKLFVSALRFFKQIDVYNNDLILKFSIQQENNIEPVFAEGEHEYLDEKTIFHYIDVYTTSKYIYAIYCGKDFKNAEPNIGNEVHVFSWEGEAICKLILDTGISNLVVKDNDNTLIGFRWYDSQPIILYSLTTLQP